MTLVPEAPAMDNNLNTHTNVFEGENPLAVDNGQTKEIKKKKKKKSGPFNFFRAALVALGTTDNKKKKKKWAPEKEDNIKDNNKNKGSDGNVGDWKKIVGSMRPLHLQQDNPSPPPPFPARTFSADSLDLADLINMQLHQRRPCLSPSPSTSSSSGGTMSQYASASNLQALDDADENDDDPDVVFDAVTGDDMIDSKAEEFIAQFYQQIKLDHHHHLLHRRRTSAFY